MNFTLHIPTAISAAADHRLLTPYIDLNALQNGIKTTTSFAEQMNIYSFFPIMKIMASSFAPFLGYAGPILSIVFGIASVLVQSPSSELREIKRLYDNMNARFDLMEARFIDIENDINWNTALAPVLLCERKTRTLLHDFQNLYKNPPPDAEGQKNILLGRYDPDCPSTLYYTIMNGTRIFGADSTNILRAGMYQLSNDRTKMRKLMISLTSLLYKACTLDLMYIIHQTPDNFNYSTTQWINKFVQIQNKMLEIDQKVYSNWYVQTGADIQNITNRLRSTSNKDLSVLLYTVLSTKYYWRDWLVVVYNPIVGGDVHDAWQCGGYFKVPYYGRNLLVSSVDKNKTSIDMELAQRKMNSLQKTCLTTVRYSCGRWTCQLIRVAAASTILSWFYPDVRTQCSPFASLGVIGVGHNVWYMAPDNRLFLGQLDKCRYNIHMFG